MDVIALAQTAVQLIQQGRGALKDVTDAVADGRVALDARTQAELDALLQEERNETRAAFNALEEAIRAAR